jgi:hypothetical protein
LSWGRRRKARRLPSRWDFEEKILFDHVRVGKKKRRKEGLWATVHPGFHPGLRAFVTTEVVTNASTPFGVVARNRCAMEYR